jgi:hypothetical protein
VQNRKFANQQLANRQIQQKVRLQNAESQISSKNQQTDKMNGAATPAEGNGPENY